MDINKQSLSDLLFLLTTDSVKNNAVLKANIEKRVHEIQKEDSAKRKIEEEQSKSNSKYWWIILVIFLSSLSYCSYQVFTSDKMVKKYAYTYNIPVMTISEKVSKKSLSQFIQEDLHNDAMVKFPELGDSLRSRIRLNIKRSRDITSGKETAWIKLKFVVSEEEKGIYDHNAVLAFYFRRISVLMNINPEPYLKEINEKLAVQKI